MKDRNISLDLLKVGMAFGVVALHAEIFADVSEVARYLAVNGILRLAVPVFLLINGFYFYPVIKAGEGARWLKKMSVLYVFWMLAYAGYWFHIPPLSLAGVLQFSCRIFVGFWHLWYLSGLIGAALITIALRNNSYRRLLGLASVTFSIGIVVQYSSLYHWFDNASIDRLCNLPWVHRNFLLYSFPFFIIGFLINQYALHERVSTKRALQLMLTGVALVELESYLNFRSAEDQRYIDNLISMIIAAPACFVYFIRQEIRRESKYIGLYASAVYYVQGFVLITLSHYLPLGSQLALVAVVITAALAVGVMILHKKFKFIL